MDDPEVLALYSAFGALFPEDGKFPQDLRSPKNLVVRRKHD